MQDFTPLTSLLDRLWTFRSSVSSRFNYLDKGLICPIFKMAPYVLFYTRVKKVDTSQVYPKAKKNRLKEGFHVYSLKDSGHFWFDFWFSYCSHAGRTGSKVHPKSAGTMDNGLLKTGFRSQ